MRAKRGRGEWHRDLSRPSSYPCAGGRGGGAVVHGVLCLTAFPSTAGPDGASSEGSGKGKGKRRDGPSNLHRASITVSRPIHLPLGTGEREL